MIDLTWFKKSGLAAAQSAAHAVLAVLGGNLTDVLHLNWEQIASVGAGAALVSVLSSVVAYQLPGQPSSMIARLRKPAPPGSHEAP